MIECVAAKRPRRGVLLQRWYPGPVLPFCSNSREHCTGFYWKRNYEPGLHFIFNPAPWCFVSCKRLIYQEFTRGNYQMVILVFFFQWLQTIGSIAIFYYRFIRRMCFTRHSKAKLLFSIKSIFDGEDFRNVTSKLISTPSLWYFPSNTVYLS